MSAHDGTRQELLSDSEATLRQVRGILDDLTESEEGVPTAPGLGQAPEDLARLVRVLVGTYTEITEVIEKLKDSRSFLEKPSMDRLEGTHMRFEEGSSAAEQAAAGMLDGIDRALALVDRLENADEAEAGEDHPANATRDALRRELHGVMDLLQFQDITSQKLGYASSVLLDIEQRMVKLSTLFDTRLGLVGADVAAPKPSTERTVNGTCDPGASTLSAQRPQALADEIFTVREAG